MAVYKLLEYKYLEEYTANNTWRDFKFNKIFLRTQAQGSCLLKCPITEWKLAYT